MNEITTPAPQGAPNQIEPAPQREIDEVKRLMGGYKLARKFDEEARKQYAQDRRYAAGTANSEWAVDANLLGSYIDILTAYIYARNPKVRIRPTEAAVQAHPRDHQEFTSTMQIIVERLWKDGRLKQCGKKLVRSGYTVGIGWFKANILTDTKPDPVMLRKVNDIQDNIARVRAQRALIESGDAPDLEEAQTTLERELQGLASQTEIVLRKIMAIDFCRAEDVQVSLDVADLSDYLSAGWVSHDIYVTLEDARAMFPQVPANELEKAIRYYQQKPTPGKASNQEGEPTADDAHQYRTAGEGGIQSGALHDEQGRPVEFVKVIELWDRKQTLIKTMIDGVPRFAKQPYPPKYSTSRFYCFFMLELFPVDGERHPQSMSWRLHKLQDEYTQSRSNFRLTRQRSIPAVIFNAEQVDKENAERLSSSDAGEYVGLNITDPEADFRKIFIAKPLPPIDMALFDNTAVIADMEKISGVQEALQSSQTVEKTATQAEIEQSGFAARTTAQRDSLEDLMTDFAQYTAENALQCLSHKEAQRYAGEFAFWPEGLPPEEITTLLNVEIEAGSTGRPNTAAEREAWANVLPILRETMLQVTTARQIGDFATADALTELIRETLTRLDDRIDVERFIPSLEQTMLTPLGGAPGGVPGAPGGGAPGGELPPGSPNAAAPLPEVVDPLAA